MSSNINLRELWGRKETEIPDMKSLMRETQNFKKMHLRKLILTNLLLLSTSAFIVYIWYLYQPQSVTTKIGILLMIGAMVMYLIVYNSLIPILRKVDESLSTSEYLSQLVKLRERQKVLETVMLNLYFLLLSVGLSFYMFEYTSRMTILWAAVTYFVTFLWMGLNWLYIRPRTIKKQREKLNNLIRKFENLKSQLE